MRLLIFLCQGSLNNNPIILEGRSSQSRFGGSVVNMGDINGDNYEGKTGDEGKTGVNFTMLFI